MDNFQFGIIPEGTTTTNYCTRGDFDQTCNNNYLDEQAFTTAFQSTCLGKNICKMSTLT